MKIRTRDDPEYRRLTALRNDALARGMDDLSVMYGWALMNLGLEIIEHNNVVLRQQKFDLTGLGFMANRRG